MSISHPVIDPVTPRIGALVRGADLSQPLDAGSLATLKQALTDHQVLIFHDQDLDPAAMKRLGDHLGAMDSHPQYGVPEFPQVLTFFSDTTSDHVISEEWHTDSSWIAVPPIASGLFLGQVPPMGGMLSFASMYAAYDALSAPMKAYLEGLTARHDGRLSRYTPSAPDPTAIHPVIRTHPATGRKTIYVNRVFTDRIIELPEPEGAAVLQFLFDHIANAFFHVRFEWQPGMLALWDNRCTQHLSVWNCPPRGCGGYRIQIEDRPDHVN